MDVLIVGAGPVGLALAAECRKYGVSFRIVDQNPGPSAYSKALAVWSATIEHLAAIDMAERFLEAGRTVRGVIFEDNGKKIAQVNLSEDLDTLYPNPFILPQSETEKLLVEHLLEKGVTVERNTQCMDIRPSAEGVEADLQGADGGQETVRAKWLAGCDGARSVVRRKLPVEFQGVTEKMGFILADAKADGDLPADRMVISSGPGGNVMIFPVKPGIWRIFALREKYDDKSQPTLEEIQQHVDGSGLGRIRFHDAEWLSHFAVNERVASRNRVGRVFLLGDASHIHSPAGGQGMNTGLQDAFNLGWKLKLLSSGRGDWERIAESYFEERHPVAQMVVKETTKLLHFGVESHAFVRAAKRLILPLVTQLETTQRTASFHLSELGISYAQSAMIEADSKVLRRSGDLRPGTRARNAEVFEEGRSLPLWREFLRPGFTLLIFAGSERAEAEKILQAVPGGLVNLAVVCREVGDMKFPGAKMFSDPGGKAHARYGIAESGWYWIRPDQFIGARGTFEERELLEGCFAKIT